MPGTQEIYQVGKREDLSDIIAVADAKGTPFTSMIRKGNKPTNTLSEWQADGYDEPNTDGVLDGKDVETFEDAAANRERIGGRVQKFWRTPMVTDMAETVSNPAGVKSEFSAAKAKKSVEIKRDMEAAFLSDNDSQPQSGSNPYKTRGMGKWLDSAAQADLPVPEAYRTPAGSIFSSALSGFTEDSLRTLLQSRYEQCGTTDQLVGFVGTDLKKAISDFVRYAPDKASNSHVRRFNQQTSEAAISTTVDFYESDFGSVELHLSSFVPNTKRGYFVDMRLVEMRANRLPGFVGLENRGGGPRGIIDAIVMLCVLNPLAHCKVAAS